MFKFGLLAFFIPSNFLNSVLIIVNFDFYFLYNLHLNDICLELVSFGFL